MIIFIKKFEHILKIKILLRRYPSMPSTSFFTLNQKKFLTSLFFIFSLLFIFSNKSSVYGENFPDPAYELSQKIIQNRSAAKKNWTSRATIGIITASDSLRAESGLIAAGLLKTNGYKVKNIMTVKNLDLEAALKQMLTDSSINVIICIGGTGITPHDVSIEAVNQFIQQPLPGFGELFRHLTYEKTKSLSSQIGLLSLDTRATAGVYNGVLIFAVPGSPHATTLAVEDIIIPGVPNLLRQLSSNEKL